MSVHLKRRDFIRLAGAAAASGFVRGAPRVAPRILSAPPKAGRPNVLLITLDDLQAYEEKLTRIFATNEIRSVTVVRMEVPCCGGISMAARRSLAASGGFGLAARPTPRRTRPRRR